MPSRPWFKFYVHDWLSNMELQSCSSAARGMLIDALCLMHQSPRRGFLRRGESPLTVEQIASLTHRSASEAAAQLGELCSAGVIRRDDAGCYYSARMVRDDARSNEGRKHVQKRKRRKQKKPDLQGDLEGDLQGTLGRSSGLWTLDSGFCASLPEVLNTERFKSAWRDWEEHRRQIRKKLTPKAVELAVQKLAEMGHDRAIAAIEHSIANGWQGIFEPDRPLNGSKLGAPKAMTDEEFAKYERKR